MDEYGDYGTGYGTPAEYGYGYSGEAQYTGAESGYGYGYSGAEYGYGAGHDSNPMGLPSVEQINAYAGAQLDQTTSTLDAATSEMNQQSEQYGQTIDAMNYDGRYDGVLAAADTHDSQMAYGYQQYGNAVGAQTDAESWEQAGAQSYWVGQNL